MTSPLSLKRLLTLSAALLLATSFAAAPASAQRLGREIYKNKQYGFQLRYPDGWLVVPVQNTERDLGDGIQKIGQIEGPELATRLEKANASYDTKVYMDIYLMEAKAAVTRDDDAGSGGLRSRVRSESSRPTFSTIFERFDGLQDQAEGEATERRGRDVDMMQQEFRAWTGNYNRVWDNYTFNLEDYDIVVVFTCAEEHLRDWQRTFYKSARSLELIERVEPVELGEDPTYEERLAYEKWEAAKTPGWEVYETPSKRYIIHSSSDDEDFLEEVIERLENSRDLFERDFPPDKPIEHVSRVRICTTKEEFDKYGKTGGGVLGWFRPSTTELVLFDAKNYDRNISFGVMTHEGFHQYCHFLFNQSEAHRWFDEGHGDYYGGFEWVRGRPRAQARMRGIDRLQEIRDRMRKGGLPSIAEHVQMDHRTWQSSYGYPQSWSIVWMLRQGMEGNVPRKLWEEEWADIIPNYMRVLSEEYEKAWDELREEVRRRKERAGEKVEPEDLEVPNLKNYLPTARKQEIWDKAFRASWGQIDIEKFEEYWYEYVKSHIKT